jgi:apolipoprotein N-acyltransferase
MGMMMGGIGGLLLVVPVAVLLSISFFVLVVLRKQELRQLKVFGMVVCAFLWLSATAIAGMGIYKVALHRQAHAYRGKEMMHRGMGFEKERGQRPMQLPIHEQPGQED